MVDRYVDRPTDTSNQVRTPTIAPGVTQRNERCSTSGVT